MAYWILSSPLTFRAFASVSLVFFRECIWDGPSENGGSTHELSPEWTPDGDYVFLELNPNGQWGWLNNATEDPYTERIATLLDRGSGL